MKKFNYNDELRNMITTKQLVEVNLRHDLGHSIAYIIDTNDEYITFAKVSNDITLDGVTICLMSDIESIQTETPFIRELKKSMSDELLHNRVMEIVKSVKQFSFKGLVQTFVNTKTILIITADSEQHTGRVVAYDDTILVIDEYYAEEKERFSRTYINPSIITSITVGGTWLNIISRSVDDKNL